MDEIIPHKALPNSRSQRFTPLFSSKGFYSVALTLESVIHFELIFVLCVRKGSSLILLQVALCLCQHHVLEKPFLLNWFGIEDS